MSRSAADGLPGSVIGRWQQAELEVSSVLERDQASHPGDHWHVHPGGLLALDRPRPAGNLAVGGAEVLLTRPVFVQTGQPAGFSGLGVSQGDKDVAGGGSEEPAGRRNHLTWLRDLL